MPRVTRPTCSTWEPAAVSGWPSCRRGRRARSRPRPGRRTSRSPHARSGRSACRVVRDEGARRQRASRPNDEPRGVHRPARRSAAARSPSSSTGTRRSSRARSRGSSRRGGVFLTQQVDNGNLDDCVALFAVEPPLLRTRPGSRSRSRRSKRPGSDRRGRPQRASRRYRFADVGALAWYLRAVMPLHPEWARLRPDCNTASALAATRRRAWQHGRPVAIRQRAPS